MSFRFQSGQASPAAGPLHAALLFGVPLFILALGHTLSSLLRTLPAVAVDVISSDIAVSAATLASLTGAYHLSFALGQIPAGIALDRYGVRAVALVLLTIIGIGAVLAATVGGAAGFLLAQIVLGIGCCGMLLCPMTFAAKQLTPAQFGLWSALIQTVGNSGMLLSANPMAWLVETQGWRAGFWVSAGFALVIGIAVMVVVPNLKPSRGATKPLMDEARKVVSIGLSRQLRGVMIIAFAGFAALIAVRGLWGGPWLMDVKHLSRSDAASALVPFTLALIFAPIVFGVLDRRFSCRRMMIFVCHLIGAVALFAVAVGGPGGVLSRLLGVSYLPAGFDIQAFLALGIALSVIPLVFAMGREAVPPEHAGKALAAINLSVFAGAAVLQGITSPVASYWGLPAVMIFLGGALMLASCLFWWFTRSKRG